MLLRLYALHFKGKNLDLPLSVRPSGQIGVQGDTYSVQRTLELYLSRKYCTVFQYL